MESSNTERGWSAGLLYEDTDEKPKFYVQDVDGMTVYEKP